MIRTGCVRLWRWVLCISPVWAGAMILFLIIAAVLYRYPSGNDRKLDILVSGTVVISFTVLIVHMFWDRGLTIWDAPSTGIVYAFACVLALFGYFFWTWVAGRMPPGMAEAWLDVCRATALVGGPLATGAVIVHHIRVWRSGRRHGRPGELLMTPVPDRLIGDALIAEESDRPAGEDRRKEHRRKEDRVLRGLE